ncbi:MAG: hypothetical protein NTW95_10705 [Candidatus Aminicenantes bacterium]|nr:hypothetical protein [Candidatus Aminicenantes bacterium]
MTRRKSLWLWLLALLLTAVVSVYQRVSGPTYPTKGKEILAGAEVSYKFYRSWTSGQPLPVMITTSGGIGEAWLHYRRYPLPGGEDWTKVPLEKKAGVFHAVIPSQPPAGKVIYHVEVSVAGQHFRLNNDRPTLARFKGKVPAVLLIVHILFMFGGLLLAFRTGLEAMRRDGPQGPRGGGRWQRMVPWTLATVCIGGLLLGPLVQKYAFGAFWTGFPLGSDLKQHKKPVLVLVIVLGKTIRFSSVRTIARY